MEYIFFIKRIFRILSINLKRFYRIFTRFVKSFLIFCLAIFLIWFVIMSLGGKW